MSDSSSRSEHLIKAKTVNNSSSSRQHQDSKERTADTKNKHLLNKNTKTTVSKWQQQQQVVPNYQEKTLPKQQVNDSRSSSEHLNTKTITTSERQQQQTAPKHQECSSTNKNQPLAWLPQKCSKESKAESKLKEFCDYKQH
ncbi:hypothetical protein MAM1_0044d03067 [Mucor ambiguus]|uniref:Uncharacterized protein n=1 Tax=Mucor ambiguus TaxID=91626 RepID=A0A0C9MKE6_9FUNG|nr:hypothetical protein MAM1_0044d03067 [Mucor ambiguus]